MARSDSNYSTIIRQSHQTGAVCFYIPETGISLDQLRKDVEFLKLRYGLDEKGKSEGRLILRFVLYRTFFISPPSAKRRLILSFSLPFFHQK